MESNLKARESRARRAVKREGYQLKKTPSRSNLRAIHGDGYMVISPNNTVVMGAASREYQATLEDVELWVAQRKAA